MPVVVAAAAAETPWAQRTSVQRQEILVAQRTRGLGPKAATAAAVAKQTNGLL
jgi:hypothetical protein